MGCVESPQAHGTEGAAPRGQTTPSSKRWQVFAPKRRHGLYAVDTLAPHWVLHAHKTHYFHDLIQRLHSCGYTDGYSLFAFGYDWRQVGVRGALGGRLCTHRLSAPRS